ncbi:MAG: DUF370 domain-containing protein [Ruminococcaceae bacterium]|nr:DUF370 domain-containing protein [Oscillospiraceae bacterium]
MKFINVGFGNMVAVERIVALASPEAAPIKRLVQNAKDDGRAIDVTCGRRTRSVIITDSEHVILSAIQTETLAGRLENREAPEYDEELEKE